MTVSAGEHDVGSLRGRLARALAGDGSVRLAWLHGSRARGTSRRESDIDVAVLLDDDHAANTTAIKDSIWRLAGALGREVPSDRLDLVAHLGQSALNGQFRTPRQLRAFIVEMVAPELGDTVYDPACGTAGFLIDVVDYVLARYSEEPEELPIYGEDWLERREQTLEEARKENPNLRTYRKGTGEKIPDWPRFEASIHGTDVSRPMMRISMMNLKNDIPGLLASWVEYKASDFRTAPGVEARTVLDPGSDEPRCWWAPSGLIGENDYNFAASRYKPQVAEELPDEDPAALIREVLAIEREITAGLEKQLEEVER